jgi:hypothetical protein
VAQTRLSRPRPVRWWWAAPCAAIILLAAPMPPWAVEQFYARDLYPWVQVALTTLSNLAPFALLDALIVAAVAVSVFRLVRAARLAGAFGVWTALRDLVQRTLRAAGVLGVIFVVVWGANYRRLPLETTLTGGVAAQPTPAMLQAAISDANTLAVRVRPAMAADPDLSYAAAADLLRGPMGVALTQLNRTPLRQPGRPKTSFVLTPFFTWAGVNGMIDPLLLESIVHPDLLPFERPFVLAHEWAHLAGQADEAEASAVGWLACMNGDPRLVYSASLYLILEAGGALTGPARRGAFAGLDPGVRMDLAAIGRRMALQNPRVEQAASRVYDTYLRANRVEDGTASYSRALRLILSDPIHAVLTQAVVR